MIIKRKLPDMGMTPPRRPYERPAASISAVVDFSPILLEGEHLQQLHIRQWTYRGKIVDFALVHTVTIDGVEATVARIDCCNGSIHRHAYLQDGTDVLDHLPIRELWDDDDTWEIVDQEYGLCWDRMIDEAEMNYRRWSHGR